MHGFGSTYSYAFGLFCDTDVQARKHRRILIMLQQCVVSIYMAIIYVSLVIFFCSLLSFAPKYYARTASKKRPGESHEEIERLDIEKSKCRIACKTCTPKTYCKVQYAFVS
uniref:Uncharacterized protein n=1 Tax=Leptocylindrus danicus TaxID=163516 RepID=A0A7S2K213_9STRA|mmetsp:Transcript_15374/g.22691  ORF Transcript_15374/g.22691 Transcript_15374/m.22691 type:complete len:111 (+) Transcript_15374:68-400(+)